MENTQKISTKKIVLTALMAALTFVGSYLRIKLPVSVMGTTAFHLGNIFCALSGILLGPGLGGLAAGMGSMIFDMMDPNYIDECLITFVMKGMYGLITGLPGEGEEEFQELCEFLKETRLERVGAFAFSPEEGTPAAEMEFVDNEIAQKRAELVEMIQSEIMDAYNESFIGKTLEILVDGFDEEFEQFYGRTYADSPDIDGRVWIASDEPLREGQFVTVTIDGIVDGDLAGYLA